MSKLMDHAQWPLQKMSALKFAALANILIIVIAEIIAIASWYALYGVFGSAVMITAAITLIASALPLVTMGIFMMNRLDTTNKDLAESKLELKARAAEALRIKEEQLSEVSERLNRALEDVDAANHDAAHCLALISHELRTPLNAIIGCSEAMQRETFGPIGSTKYHEFTDNIFKSGNYLLAVINDVLELSKVEGGTDDINEEQVDVAELLADVKRLVAEVCTRYEIELATVQADDVTQLYADPVKLKQILINLVTNAIKYTPAGGACHIEARCSDDADIEFHVVDSGSCVVRNGAPDGDDEDRRDDPMALTATSAGLGLPLSEALARLHGGRIDMLREQDGGSRVIVTLPADRAVAAIDESLVASVA